MSLRFPESHVRLLAVCLLAALLWRADASAVLIAQGDGMGNTTNPNFFGWDYVGEVNGSTATYIGDGWVLTANHVGAGDLTLDAVVYPMIPGSDTQLESIPAVFADVVMFRVSPQPPGLGMLSIRSAPPPVGEFLFLIGCGRDRGPATSWDPNGPLPPPPDPLDGWFWAQTSTKRWGTNEVDQLVGGLISGTVTFATEFDEGELLPEAHAANGDSGGAIFSLNATSIDLAGIIIASGPSPGQPAETALYTNFTFAARLDHYKPEIDAIIAAPEPANMLAWGLGTLALLARRRRR
jgi:hypothetical protein